MMAGSIEGIGNVRGLDPAQGSQGPQRLERRGDTGWLEVVGPSFGDTLKQALGEVSALQEGARDSIAAFVRGDPVELHEVMAATEEAGLALEFLIEIRNKVTEAYRAVINMQA